MVNITEMNIPNYCLLFVLTCSVTLMNDSYNDNY